MNSTVVVLGSVNADLLLRCPSLPRPGETVHGHGFRTLPGGKGANQAVAAARLGAQVVFVGCVGDDDFGRAAAATLAREGIDTTHLQRVPGSRTGVAMILVEDSGQNCIALSAEANGALGVAQVDAAAARIRQAALLVCQLESPLAAVRHAIGIAHAAGVPVLLNPAPARPLPDDLLAQVEVLVPNESEAAVLLGAEGRVPAAGPDAAGGFDAADAAARLRRRGPRTVIVTLGAAGVQVADAAGNRHFAAPPVRAVDTTGAGDTFIGAYAAARCEGQDLPAAVAFAQRAAALSVTRAGAIDAIPHRHELALPPG